MVNTLIGHSPRRAARQAESRGLLSHGSGRSRRQTLANGWRMSAASRAWSRPAQMHRTQTQVVPSPGRKRLCHLRLTDRQSNSREDPGHRVPQLVTRPMSTPLVAAIAEVLLLVVILVSAVRYQAPQHARLSSGFDAAVYRTLVRSNWVRTVAWSALGVLDLWLIWHGLPHS
jgi:hypothetical protein